MALVGIVKGLSQHAVQLSGAVLSQAAPAVATRFGLRAASSHADNTNTFLKEVSIYIQKLMLQWDVRRSCS
jgi:hypothetical protein